MMDRLDIELKQCWETIDEAIDYFLNLVLDLQAAKRQPELPTDLYLDIAFEGKIEDEILCSMSIRLTSL